MIQISPKFSQSETISVQNLVSPKCYQSEPKKICCLYLNRKYIVRVLKTCHCLNLKHVVSLNLAEDMLFLLAHFFFLLLFLTDNRLFRFGLTMWIFFDWPWHHVFQIWTDNVLSFIYLLIFQINKPPDVGNLHFGLTTFWTDVGSWLIWHLIQITTLSKAAIIWGDVTQVWFW